jgi:hypothetical protein
MPEDKLDLKTSGIKLSELEPCSFCDGPLGTVFRIVEVKHAIVNLKNANQTLALAQGFGLGLQLAEVMGAGGDRGVEVLENEEAVTRLFCCQDCLCGIKKGLSQRLVPTCSIAEACERVNERRAKKNEKSNENGEHENAQEA